jgi:nucleotide-binding universal stress UspA family protein
MRPIRHVLCPMDFSQWSLDALQCAALLCRALGAELTLLHVFELPAFAVPPPGQTSIASASVDEAIKRVSAELGLRLDAVAAGLDLDGRTAKTLLRDGVPYRVITEAAEELHADMIVMGTHGRTGMQRLLVGSVAERVVRAATCPVLTVPRPKT